MTPIEDVNPEAEAETLTGKLIAGNFRIQRLIGSGAMGNVYQAEQISLGKAVAIKVLHPHLMGDGKLIARFQREAKSASRLNHANSIQIIDSGQDASGALYIAMELIEGRDLARVIRDEFPLPLPRVVRIMSQVLSALDEAHAHGVVHRDLKPSNIMLMERRGEPDFVKVCDYGIAKAQMDDGQVETQMLTVQGLVCGTPEYMSPEQARGEPLDGRTDLYSAAVILYQMVTGDIPFRAATPIGIVSRHLSEVPALPSARRPDPSISAELDDLILRGLAKSRELRPPTAAAFREELESVGAGRPGRSARAAQNTIPASRAVDDASPTTQLPMRAAPRGRPRRRGQPLAIALIVLAVGAAALLVTIKRSRTVPAASGVLAPAVTARLSPPASSLPALAATPQAPPAAEPHAALPAGAGQSAPSSASAGTSPRIESAATPRPEGNQGTADEPPAEREESAKRDNRRPTPARPRPAMLPSSPASLASPPFPQAADRNAMPGKSVAAADEDKPLVAPAAEVGPREAVTDGEKLLSQGEVAEACRRGEDAKKASPRLPAIYKFLGKCYMRAGDPVRAKENYRRYLELAPGASDAMFIESIVK